jgi:hypothetical protein
MRRVGEGPTVATPRAVTTLLHTAMSWTHADSVQQLNTFLRSELSAVDTYDQAIEWLGSDSEAAEVLQACRDSHQRRAAVLRRAIQSLGGIPSVVSGIWGSFAELADGPPAAVTKEAALAALIRGERYGCADYERRSCEMSPAMQTFVDARLAPAQRRALAAVVGLQRRTVDSGFAGATPGGRGR